MKRKFRKDGNVQVSEQSVWVMLLGTVVILLQLGYIAFDIFSGTANERFHAVLLYRSCFEYVLLEIVLILGGAFLFDAVVKDTESD